MTIESRRDEFSFSNLMKVPTEELGGGGQAGFVFPGVRNPRGGGIDCAKGRGKAGTHECLNTHAKLMEDLVAHITDTLG